MQHRTIRINHQPDATVFQFIILTFICSSTCFGRFPAHHQELNGCSGSLWFYLRVVVTAVLCSWSGRPARPRTQHGWWCIWLVIYLKSVGRFCLTQIQYKDLFQKVINVVCFQCVPQQFRLCTALCKFHRLQNPRLIINLYL